MSKDKNEFIKFKLFHFDKEGLKGQVKEIMQTCYKAFKRDGINYQGKIDCSYQYNPKNFIIKFDLNGVKKQDNSYSEHGNSLTNYFDTEKILSNYSYNKKGVLNYKLIYTYNKFGKTEGYKNINSEEKVLSSALYKYDKRGNHIEYITYNSEGKIGTKVIHVYDKNNNCISSTSYEKGEKIIIESIRKYNEKGNEIEYFSTRYRENNEHEITRYTTKYNENGLKIETTFYDANGNVKEISQYQYDSDGNMIGRFIDEDKAEKEILEYDAKGNWIKKTIVYNEHPINIYVREIRYFDDENVDNFPPFEHPLVNANEDEIEDENKSSKNKYNNNEGFELDFEQLKWIAEQPNITSEYFPNYRYYIAKFNEIPSIVSYTGPYIEAIALCKELELNMEAEIIHKYTTIWDGIEKLVRYTLSFPEKNYLLTAIQITNYNAEEFLIPDFVKKHKSDYGEYYYANISQIQLLKPNDVSDKDDWYFESRLNENIDKCMLKKKPDKPRIQMIEVRGNSFAMVEHAVDDNFEIKDLNVNYGYGFEKFHNELMHRFNSETKGLVLFHGQPGTGKTYYIRHLLRKMVSSNRKIVIYMPPNMVDHLVEPTFMTFLSDQVKKWSQDDYFCVLLIEDAEPLLAKRQEGVRIQGVTNLLNMSDGLLNDMLNLQIICTFNVDLKRLDSALLRPGRLIARKEFKPLSELDANLLAQRLGIKHHFTKPATLGEVYAKMKNKNTLIHDIDSNKGASTIADDF